MSRSAAFQSYILHLGDISETFHRDIFNHLRLNVSAFVKVAESAQNQLSQFSKFSINLRAKFPQLVDHFLTKVLNDFSSEVGALPQAETLRGLIEDGLSSRKFDPRVTQLSQHIDQLVKTYEFFDLGATPGAKFDIHFPTFFSLFCDFALNRLDQNNKPSVQNLLQISKDSLEKCTKPELYARHQGFSKNNLPIRGKPIIDFGNILKSKIVSQSASIKLEFARKLHAQCDELDRKNEEGATLSEMNMKFLRKIKKIQTHMVQTFMFDRGEASALATLGSIIELNKSRVEKMFDDLDTIGEEMLSNSEFDPFFAMILNGKVHSTFLQNIVYSDQNLLVLAMIEQAFLALVKLNESIVSEMRDIMRSIEGDGEKRRKVVEDFIDKVRRTVTVSSNPRWDPKTMESELSAFISQKLKEIDEILAQQAQKKAEPDIFTQTPARSIPQDPLFSTVTPQYNMKDLESLNALRYQEIIDSDSLIGRGGSMPISYFLNQTGFSILIPIRSLNSVLILVCYSHPDSFPPESLLLSISNAYNVRRPSSISQNTRIDFDPSLLSSLTQPDLLILSLYVLTSNNSPFYNRNKAYLSGSTASEFEPVRSIMIGKRYRDDYESFIKGKNGAGGQYRRDLENKAFEQQMSSIAAGDNVILTRENDANMANGKVSERKRDVNSTGSAFLTSDHEGISAKPSTFGINNRFDSPAKFGNPSVRESYDKAEAEQRERERKRKEELAEKERMENEIRNREAANRKLEQEKLEAERLRKQKEENDRLERERTLELERQIKERENRANVEKEEAARLEREKKIREDMQKVETERREQEERNKRMRETQKLEEERLEKERFEREKRDREDRERREREDRERKEREDKERREREESERREREERDRREREEREKREREDRERREREDRERREREEKERKEREEKDRREREEKERKEREERESRERKEKEERERKEKEDRERKEREDKERKMREEAEKLERELQDREAKAAEAKPADIKASDEKPKRGGIRGLKEIAVNRQQNDESAKEVIEPKFNFERLIMREHLLTDIASGFQEHYMSPEDIEHYISSTEDFESKFFSVFSEMIREKMMFLFDNNFSSKIASSDDTQIAGLTKQAFEKHSQSFNLPLDHSLLETSLLVFYLIEHDFYLVLHDTKTLQTLFIEKKDISSKASASRKKFLSFLTKLHNSTPKKTEYDSLSSKSLSLQVSKKAEATLDGYFQVPQLKVLSILFSTLYEAQKYPFDLESIKSQLGTFLDQYSEDDMQRFNLTTISSEQVTQAFELESVELYYCQVIEEALSVARSSHGYLIEGISNPEELTDFQIKQTIEEALTGFQIDKTPYRSILLTVSLQSKSNSCSYKYFFHANCGTKKAILFRPICQKKLDKDILKMFNDFSTAKGFRLSFYEDLPRNTIFANDMDIFAAFFIKTELESGARAEENLRRLFFSLISFVANEEDEEEMNNQGEFDQNDRFEDDFDADFDDDADMKKSGGKKSLEKGFTDDLNFEDMKQPIASKKPMTDEPSDVDFDDIIDDF